MDISNFGAVEWIQVAYVAAAVSHLMIGFISMNVKLPDFMWRMLVYGKLVERDHKTRPQGEAPKESRSWMQVPKSWFLHYYVAATLTDGYGLWLVLTDECYAFSQVLLGVLLLVNSVRRLQESACVCVFSKATMHVAHYVLGIAYYLARNYLAQLALSSYYKEQGSVSRSPPGALYAETCWSPASVDCVVWALLAMCCYAMYMQHRALIELASLRSDPASRNKHMIPFGSTFKYVSCPHYFWELVLYTGFELMIAYLVRTPFHTFSAVYFLVIVNQTISAIETHRWYHMRFSDYPKERKALIPFIL